MIQKTALLLFVLLLGPGCRTPSEPDRVVRALMEAASTAQRIDEVQPFFTENGQKRNWTPGPYWLSRLKTLASTKPLPISFSKTGNEAVVKLTGTCDGRAKVDFTAQLKRKARVWKVETIEVISEPNCLEDALQNLEFTYFPETVPLISPAAVIQELAAQLKTNKDEQSVHRYFAPLAHQQPEKMGDWLKMMTEDAHTRWAIASERLGTFHAYVKAGRYEFELARRNVRSPWQIESVKRQ